MVAHSIEIWKEAFWNVKLKELIVFCNVDSRIMQEYPEL